MHANYKIVLSVAIPVGLLIMIVAVALRLFNKKKKKLKKGKQAMKRHSSLIIQPQTNLLRNTQTSIPFRFTGGSSQWEPPGTINKKYKAIQSYSPDPAHDDELLLAKDDVVQALEFFEDGWVKVLFISKMVDLELNINNLNYSTYPVHKQENLVKNNANFNTLDEKNKHKMRTNIIKYFQPEDTAIEVKRIGMVPFCILVEYIPVALPVAAYQFQARW